MSNPCNRDTAVVDLTQKVQQYLQKETRQQLHQHGPQDFLQGLLHQQRRPFCLCCAAYFQFEPELAVPVPDVSGDESAVEGLAAAAVEGETPEVCLLSLQHFETACTCTNSHRVWQQKPQTSEKAT